MIGSGSYGSFLNPNSTFESARAADNYLYLNGGARSGGLAASGAGITVASQTDLHFRTNVTWAGDWNATGVETMTLLTTGNVGIGTATPTSTLTVNGSFARNIVTTTATTYTVSATDTHIIANVAGTLTLTLPAASSFTGREISVRTITGNTVVSATANVVPMAGTAAATAILAATVGKWALLVSDGTNWQIQMGK